MIVHLVLFKPRADLAAGDRHELAKALAAALRAIPSIRRARLGRRVTHGRPYEDLMRTNYEYAALFEFDDLAGLQAYLQHPAHEALAARFFAAFEEALIYDYELRDGAEWVAE
ncbi:MAG TPA: Dabb family protein [Vicinamibacterales bacterium]|nr:Dabb family protein [Vicinamibacterales bacterium]